jgi:hypothetical protein
MTVEQLAHRAQLAQGVLAPGRVVVEQAAELVGQHDDLLADLGRRVVGVGRDLEVADLRAGRIGRDLDVRLAAHSVNV